MPERFSRAAALVVLVTTVIAVGCHHRGASANAPGAPLALRYVCGNEYVAINRLRSPTSLRWLAPEGDQGTLLLPAANDSVILRWGAFQTANVSAVSLYRGIILVARVENARIRCLDERPELPDSLGVPTYNLLRKASSTRDSTWVVAREYYYLGFIGRATAQTVRRVLAAHDAVIVGGVRVGGMYIVKLPDPGSSMEAVNSVMHSLAKEPDVEVALPFVLRGFGPDR